ncbi:hypothetical protein CTAYLR_002178 [Chrysophaeum taylorii]|uniref:Prolyl 4-hydroxylase alpha subunit Fe(2+) 2OG dioxygenase domain-containing protein n=1 Tax=Chrysophaeum taylorii TaxID=2483200 RepID=A0AAD7UNZ7_9STRA|nr:hypothetical protein CTAYLR_002178 [Chrysophaeum taylorii]
MLLRARAAEHLLWATPVASERVPNGDRIAHNLTDAALEAFDAFCVARARCVTATTEPPWCERDQLLNDAFFAYQQRHPIDLRAVGDAFSAATAAFATYANRPIVAPTCWASVHANASYHPLHTHARASVSGVFFASVPKDAGGLVLMDPRGGFLPPFQRTVKLAPSVGELHLFPSWLPHLVEPTRGAEPRVSVSCNRPGDWAELADVNIQLA